MSKITHLSRPLLRKSLGGLSDEKAQMLYQLLSKLMEKNSSLLGRVALLQLQHPDTKTTVLKHAQDIEHILLEHLIVLQELYGIPS